MAAATPSRPSSCVVPSQEGIHLASELKSIGGNDITLAIGSAVKNLEDAMEVAGWLSGGFSATIAPIFTDLPFIVNLLQQIVARLDSSLELALGWIHAGATRPVDCLGQPIVSAAGGLANNAHAISFSRLDSLDAILRAAFEPALNPIDNRILTLGLYNPIDGTLASLNIIFCQQGIVRQNINRAEALLELANEVIHLHKRGIAGEFVLRSANLGLLNQLAAPLIGGNVRLFVPATCAPSELAQRIGAVKTICTRTQVPETALKWVPVHEFLQLVEAAKAQALAKENAATPPAAAAMKDSPTVSAQASIERRKKQRERVAESLQKAAAKGVAKLSAQKAAAGAATAEDDKAAQSGKLVVDIPVDCSQQFSDISFSSLSSKNPGDIIAARPSRRDCSQSPQKDLQRPRQQHQEKVLRTSHRSSGFPVNRGMSGLTSPSGAVCYGSPSPSHGAIGARPVSPSKTGGTITSYAAAYRAQHPEPTPPNAAYPSLSPRSGIGRYRGTAAGAAAANQGKALELKPPPTAALQRRLWASSTAAPPVTDVFNSIEFSIPSNINKSLRQSYANAASGAPEAVAENYANAEDQELQFDLSEQAAGNASSIAKSRQQALNSDSQSMHTATSGSIDADSSAELQQREKDLAAALAQERRVNSILLRQLQDAEQRAALATAAAAAVPPVEAFDTSDFNGAMAALQHERQRNAALGKELQEAAEAQLSLEVELAAAQKESAVAKAKSKAWERNSAVASVFAQCEAALKSAQDAAARLKKENVDLAHAVAEAEVAALVKSAMGCEGKQLVPTDSGEVITSLHNKLRAALSQVKKLQEEVAAQQKKAQAAESALRKAEVGKRAADDVLRRNAALQEALRLAEEKLQEQCLAAAKACAALGETERARDEALQALAAEQERVEELLDLAESLQLRARVGAVAWVKNGGLAATPLAVQSDAGAGPGHGGAEMTPIAG